MRALNIVYHLHHGGGIEAYLLNFFHALHKPDVQIEVCHTAPQPGSLAPEVEGLGIKVWRFRCTEKSDLPDAAKRFERELRERGPYDVVHVHLGNWAGPLLKAARRVGVPVRLAHYHAAAPGHKNDWKRRLVEYWLRRQVLRHATGIVGCAWAALRWSYPHLWNRSQRMFVLRYGIPVDEFMHADGRADVRREFGIPLDAPLIGHVGGFRWQKNHDRLLAALPAVIQRFPQVRLLLVGDGDMRPQIETWIRERGLDQHVILTGKRRDVARMLAAMDVFAFPSTTEGFGLAAVEAQAAGLPVVASDLPGPREATAPAFHRYFLNPLDLNDISRALIEALETLRNDPNLREEARRFASQFTNEACVQAMLAAWQYPGAAAPPDPCAWAGPRGAAEGQR